MNKEGGVRGKKNKEEKAKEKKGRDKRNEIKLCRGKRNMTGKDERQNVVPTFNSDSHLQLNLFLNNFITISSRRIFCNEIPRAIFLLSSPKMKPSRAAPFHPNSTGFADIL